MGTVQISPQTDSHKTRHRDHRSRGKWFLRSGNAQLGCPDYFAPVAITKLECAKALDETERGAGGYGSTGAA